jgi:dipeptidyl aminopeptidase/acylaminoacyl peptidase
MAIPFSFDDLYLHRKVASLHGRGRDPAVVCSVRSADRAGDEHRSHLWLFPLDGGEPRQLTFESGQDTSPRWSPSGDRIAFLSARDDKGVQVHLLPFAGGEAHRCSDIEGGVTSLRWCPDGRGLLVTAVVTVDPELRGRRGPPAERRPNSPEVAWKLPYKNDGMGYLLSREIHLFRVDADTGEHRRLTDGPFDVFGFDCSPQGRRIAHVRTREGRFAHRTDLWVCDADCGGARQLTDEFASVLQPAWSPDGRWIAFAGAREEGDARASLFLLEVGTGRVVSPQDDVEVADGESLHWDEGGRLLFTRAWHGCHEICSIAADGSDLRRLVRGERQFGAFTTAGDHLVFSVEQPALPEELHACRADGSGERQVSDLNAWWKERTPLEATHRRFTVPDGRGGREPIEGWLIRPRNAPGPLPLLNDAHGGPASYALLDFGSAVYRQVLCSRGWAVLLLNPVGSAGHGREFCERLSGHWGEYDLPQHLEALRQLQDEGVCDERVAIAGKSYGGFLSAWAVGHTQLFHAAVVMAPVGNIETHYGTSDGGYYADPRYVDSEPGFDRARARALSPLQHIEKSRTPVLFLQGKEDERCPKCQSEEMFVSLMRAGETPTEMVLYPQADHHFLSDAAPSQRHDAARRIVEWVHRWCVAGADEDRRDAVHSLQGEAQPG